LRRRRGSGLKKMGLLALALVLALGTLGVAYAAWTDSVYVRGTVNTGTVNINPNGSSSTFVYKVPAGTTAHYFIPEEDPSGEEVFIYPNGTQVNYVDGADEQNAPAGGLLVATAVTTFNNGASDADTATMTFTGLFPGVDFKADVKMFYVGTIPVKVALATVLDPAKAQDPTIAALWQMGETTKGDATRYGIWMEAEYTPDDGGTSTTFNDPPLGLQLEQWDHLTITVHARLPEDPTYANKSVSFSGTITVIQWNEYEATPTP
jgi:hypothetical protein